MSTSPAPVPSGGSLPPNVTPPSGGKPSNALWWALGVFGVLVFLVIVGGLLTMAYFVRNIHVDEKAQKVEVSTPAGRISVHVNDSVKAVGLPIYPGAELADSGGGVELTAPNEQRVGVTGVKYQTSDSLEKVDAWYRAQLGAEFDRRVGGDDNVHIGIQGVHIDRGDIAYVAEGPGLVRVVGLKKAFGRTEISMARIGKQEPQ